MNPNMTPTMKLSIAAARLREASALLEDAMDDFCRAGMATHDFEGYEPVRAIAGAHDRLAVLVGIMRGRAIDAAKSGPSSPVRSLARPVVL